MVPGDVVYDIDSNDLLIGFNRHWQVFAQANGGEKLDPPLIIRRPIWDFISCEETRHLHQVLVQRVRATGIAVHMAVRCDSPSLRRFSHMSIEGHGGLIRYRCQLLRTEARAEVPLIGPNLFPSEAFLRMCSWCKKIEVGPQRWEEVEGAVRTLELFSTTKLPQITHAICDACHAALYGEE